MLLHEAVVHRHDETVGGIHFRCHREVVVLEERSRVGVGLREVLKNLLRGRIQSRHRNDVVGKLLTKILQVCGTD